MRKFISMLLTLTIVFAFVANINVGAQNVETGEGFECLEAINILPGTVTEANGENPITRAEFSYMAARLMSDKDFETVDTRFTDVTKENQYSGYIEYLAGNNILSGNGGSQFNPYDNLDIFMACKILVSVMGYGSVAEQKGGYPNGYYDVAYELGLLKGVNINSSGKLTCKNAVLISYNALLAENSENSVVYGEGISFKLSNEKLLKKTFGIEIYSGIITEAFQNIYSANFKINKVHDKNQDTYFKQGENVYLSAETNIDLNKFEYVPANVWVNSEGKIVYIAPLKNVEVKFAYIDSVNGDTEEGALYSIENMNRLTFVYDEEEYDIRDDASLKYNNKLTDSLVPIVGNFAKVVTENDEVIYIESWDMKEGGIITAVTNMEITYTKGRNTDVKLKNLNEFKKVIVFVDGRSTELADIKNDSVFFYSANGDSLVLNVTEKVLTDVFNSYSADRLVLGNNSYKYKNIYYSENGASYKDDAEFNVLLGRDVKSYLAPDGRILYLCPMEKENNLSSKFYGIVTGVNKDSVLDEENAKIKMWRVEAEAEAIEVIYDVDDKTKFLDGLTLESIEATKKDKEGKGLYYFEVNANGKIRSISKPYDFVGFEGVANVTRFTSSSYPQIAAGNGEYVYFGSVNITTIYEKDGEFCVKNLPWSSFNNKASGSLQIQFFGNGEIASLPSLILCTGNVHQLRSPNLQTGIVTEISECVKDNGEIGKLLTVESITTEEYFVTEELAKKIKKNDFISYYADLPFSDDGIYLSENFGQFSTLYGNDELPSTLKYGTVEYADSRMIILNGEKPRYYHPTWNFFIEVQMINGTDYRVSEIGYQDITKGDKVLYRTATDGTRGIIKISD